MYSFHCTTQPRRFEAFKRNFPVFSPLQLILTVQTLPLPLLTTKLLWDVSRLWGPVASPTGSGPGPSTGRSEAGMGAGTRGAGGPGRRPAVRPPSYRARGGWGPDWEGALWSRHRGWTSLGPPVTQVLFTAGHFSLFRLRFRCGYQSLNELCRCLAGRDTAPDIQFNRVCGHKMRRLRWRPL